MAAIPLAARLTDAQTEAVGEAQWSLLYRLACAADFGDDPTGRHTERVGRLSARIAHQMGVPGDLVRGLERAAALHDIGKVGVAPAILDKPGKLTAAERAAMQRHTIIGFDLLSDTASPELRLAADIALCHHERWDGDGYPHGLRGFDIPLGARVVAVADVFDALTHDRPYKKAWPVAAALEHLADARWTHFDPVVVDAFLALDHAAL